MEERGRRRGRRVAALAAAIVVIAAGLALAQRAPATLSTPRTSSGPSPAGAQSFIVGTVTSAPWCPTLEPSPLPCSPRGVGGAVIVVSTRDQAERARATTAPDGGYRLALPGSATVTVTPLPVRGLLFTPDPVTMTLERPETRRIDFVYGTGIV